MPGRALGQLNLRAESAPSLHLWRTPDLGTGCLPAGIGPPAICSRLLI